MKNTLNFNFYCRESKCNSEGEAPIEVSIVINGKRAFINLPLKVQPKEFNKKKPPKYIADYLAGMRVTVNSIIVEMQANHIPLTAETLRGYIKNGGFKSYTVGDLFDDFLRVAKSRVGLETNQGTYRKYELVRDFVFQYVKPEDEVEVLTNDLMITMYTDLKAKFQPATSSSYMRKIKTIVMYAMDNDKLRINPFAGLKIKRPVKDIDYLTDEELEVLRNVHLENSSLQHILDIFLFICYSGLSFVDAAVLKASDIKKVQGMWVIEKPRVKSKIEYTAVILPPGVEIFKKYNGNLKVMSNQKMNSWLKIIQTQIGFHRDLYCHLGRKTYATLLINADVPLMSVSRCLGHSEVRTTQRYYARLHNSTAIADVAKAFNKGGEG